MLKIKDNFFEDWTVDNGLLSSKDNKYHLNLRYGWIGFEDEGRDFLLGLSLWQTWIVWRAVKRELRKRALKHFN